MKKNKFLLLVASFLAVLFIAPTHANAETVNVYFFRSSLWTEFNNCYVLTETITYRIYALAL